MRVWERYILGHPIKTQQSKAEILGTKNSQSKKTAVRPTARQSGSNARNQQKSKEVAWGGGGEVRTLSEGRKTRDSLKKRLTTRGNKDNVSGPKPKAHKPWVSSHHVRKPRGVEKDGE